MTTTTQQIDLRDEVRRVFQKAANRVARQHGYGRATKFDISHDVDGHEIVEANRCGYETKGGRPIYHPSAYSKKGWSNMVYVSAQCYVRLSAMKLTMETTP